MSHLLGLALVLFIISFSAKASQTLIDIAEPQYKIGKSTLFYEDTEHTVDFSQIEKLPANLFQAVEQNVATDLFTDSIYYYQFDVINTHDSHVNRLLVFETPWLDSIKVKIISPNGLHSDYLTGNIFPYSQRAIANPNPNIDHDFAAGLSKVYIQVKTRDPFIVPISILDRETFLQDQIFDFSITALIYGVLFAMILYHLILFMNIKLRYYGFYVLYLLSFIASNASYNNFTFHLFFADLPNVQNWIQSYTIFLFSICGLLFAKSFLSLKHYLPVAHKLTNYLIMFFVSTMIISAFFGYHYHVIFAISMSVLFSIFVFGIALLSLLKGNRSARFFLLGTTTGLIGTSITAFTVMSLIPYSDIGYHAIDYGLVIDSILLSFALVDRVKSNEKEKQLAEKSAKTDELTGLPNRRAYNEICHNKIHKDNKLHTTKMSTMMIDIDHFKEVNDTYGHPAGDIVLQRVARLLHSSIKATDYVFRMGGEEFLILMPDTDISLASHLAERIRLAVENMDVVIENNPINITISIGISEHITTNSCINLSEVKADKALYQAKQSGRNKVILSS